MGKDLKKDLILNYRDFISAAEDEFNKSRFNPAISSYFKAMVILCDVKIYSDRKTLPKNHAERFLILV